MFLFQKLGDVLFWQILLCIFAIFKNIINLPVLKKKKTEIFQLENTLLEITVQCNLLSSSGIFPDFCSLYFIYITYIYIVEP